MDVPLMSHSSSSSSSSSSVFSLSSTLYMVADPGYDDKKLYEYNKKTLGMDLICPLERYENTSKNRLELVCFYQSTLGQAVYSRRRISIEPLIEHLKSVFRIDPLPIRGLHMVSAIVLLFVLLYQLMVYYNCKTQKTNPKSIKYMLGTGWWNGIRDKDRWYWIMTKPHGHYSKENKYQISWSTYISIAV